MIKAVIFDFFGVLVGDGFDSTYREAGGDPQADKDFIQLLLDETNRGIITTDVFREKICEKLGISVESYQQAIQRAELVNLQLLKYIKELRKRYKTAILSNVNKGGLEKRFSQSTLDDYFDQVIVSGEVGYIKPEAEIYHLAAEKLGVKINECVFIDDRIGYVAGAVAVGMRAIQYQNFDQMKSELEEILAAGSDNQFFL